MILDSLLLAQKKAIFSLVIEYLADYPYIFGTIFMVGGGSLIGWAVHGFVSGQTENFEGEVVSDGAAIGTSTLRVVIGIGLLFVGAWQILFA